MAEACQLLLRRAAPIDPLLRFSRSRFRRYYLHLPPRSSSDPRKPSSFALVAVQEFSGLPQSSRISNFRTHFMNWYCVHTKPLKEAYAARHCREMFGLETYFPRIKSRRVIRRVKRVVMSPLFPRYWFCRFDINTHYRAVRHCPEVISVVNIGDMPKIVDDAIIDELKAWAGESIDVITIQPGLRPGDPVEITDGPMRGIQAVFLYEMSDQQRVTVLLSTLGCARMVIGRSQVRRDERGAVRRPSCAR